VPVPADAIHHNPKYYPDPFAFNPERYLGDDNTVGKSMNQSDPYKRDHWTYGVRLTFAPFFDHLLTLSSAGRPSRLPRLPGRRARALAHTFAHPLGVQA